MHGTNRSQLWLLGAAPLLLLSGEAQARLLSLTPIVFAASEGRIVQAERGVIEVPENRADPESRKIKLAFVRFPATGAKSAQPMVYLAGGPGGSGIDAARGARFDIFMTLRAAGDVIALDRRDTGASNAIPPCAAPQPLDLARPVTRDSLTAHYREALAHCWSVWKTGGISIESYNTWESAADLEALRKALKAPKLNLWGISYGTHLALAAAKRYPGSIDRMALASAEGLDQTVKLPARVDLGLQRLAALLGDPDLPGRMRRVHAKLDRQPARFRFTGEDGKPVAYSIGSFPAQLLAGILAKNPETAVRLPLLYGALDAGQYDPIAPLIYQALFAPGTILAGAPEATDIASGVSPARLGEVERQAAASVLGDALNFPMPQLAGLIPGVELPASFRAPFRSNIPVMLLSGTVDVRTPVEEQLDAVAGFRRLTRVTVANGGHDILEASPEVATLLLRFFRGARVPDTTIVLPPAKSAPGKPK